MRKEIRTLLSLSIFLTISVVVVVSFVFWGFSHSPAQPQNPVMGQTDGFPTSETGVNDGGSGAAADGRASVLEKDVVRQQAIGKSMAEIKAMYGPPSNVSELWGYHVVVWYYSSSDLPVVDQDSGTTAQTTAFSFRTADKVVFEVRFP